MILRLLAQRISIRKLEKEFPDLSLDSLVLDGLVVTKGKYVFIGIPEKEAEGILLKENIFAMSEFKKKSDDPYVSQRTFYWNLYDDWRLFLSQLRDKT